jgi:hypothetical protein
MLEPVGALGAKQTWALVLSTATGGGHAVQNTPKPCENRRTGEHLTRSPDARQNNSDHHWVELRKPSHHTALKKWRPHLWESGAQFGTQCRLQTVPHDGPRQTGNDVVVGTVDTDEVPGTRIVEPRIMPGS